METCRRWQRVQIPPGWRGFIDEDQGLTLPAPPHNCPPFFSVVIPTYNRPEMLRQCVQSLARQGRRELFEVIVVDDGSEPPVNLQQYEETLNPLVLRQSNGGPASSRNAGAARASGRYLVFLDDDCRAGENWLSTLEEACLSAPAKTMFGGDVRNADDTNLYCELGQAFNRVLLHYHQPRPGGLFFFGGANIVVPREEFLHLGGFDTRFRTSEDREFCDRWQQESGSFQYVAGASVTHHDSLTLLSSVRRYYRGGRGAYRYHQARHRRKSSRLGADTLTYYARVIREITRLRLGTLPAKLSLFVLWQAAVLAGFLREIARDIAQARR
jgi:glycosyltransferase involved in cell wall biosynthesis